MMSKKNKVLFFSPYGFWLIHNQLDAVVATGLQLRSCEVLVIGCDGVYNDCAITRLNNNKELLCENCAKVGKNFFEDLFGLPYMQLRNFIENDDYIIANQWVKTVLPQDYKNAKYDSLPIGKWVTSTIHTHFRIADAGLSSNYVQNIHRKYLIDGLVTYNALIRLFNKYQPTNVFLFNGRFAPYRIAFEVAHQMKIDVITHERGSIDDSFAFFDNHPTWSCQPPLDCVKAWEEITLNNEELVQTKNYFIKREYGIDINWPAFYNFQTSPVNIHHQLRIPLDAKIFAVFTSSEDELAALEGKVKITTQFDIIKNLIEIFKNRNEYLVIRHHPYIGGNKDTPIESDFLSKAYQQVFSIPENVRVVMPSEQLTSYALLWHTDAAIAFFSTVAIEAIARGVPTATLATSSYEKASRYTIQDTSIEHLNQLVDNLLKDSSKLTSEDLKRLYRFTNAYFFKFSHKFRSIGIKNFYSHELRFESLDDLQPGNDPTLDKVCNRIMLGSSLDNLPSNDLDNRLPEQEEDFYKQELQEIENHKILIKEQSLNYHNNLVPDIFLVAIIYLKYNTLSPIESQIFPDYLHKSRYKNIVIYEINDCELSNYQTIIDSILSLTENIVADYILIANNYTQYDESFISSAIDILTSTDSQDINGVFTGGWLSTVENRIEDGVFISGVFNQQQKLVFRQGNITYPQALEILPLLNIPLSALSFGILRKSALREILQEVRKIPENQAAQYLFESVFNNDNICKTELPKLVIRQELEVLNAVNNSMPELPIHFFTIVLNGQPFIKYHIEVFKHLPFKWHWHIVEGVADLKHDTSWSVKLGGNISDEIHKNGRSYDGTTEYLDEVAQLYPTQVTIYRKPEGIFWDGKREMVNAPIVNIQEECLLWQVDVDELWTLEQICDAREMFISNPEKTAAFYWCWYFVGEKLIISTRNCYTQNPQLEWLRTWRFKPGAFWAAHEPPVLVETSLDGEYKNVAAVNPFLHEETERLGLIFQHFAYVTAQQLQFKEQYYGYSNAVYQWQALQEITKFPVLLREYLSWVRDETRVDTAEKLGIVPIAQKELSSNNWQFLQPDEIQQQIAQVEKPTPLIIVDGVFFQLYQTGIARVWQSLLEQWAKNGFAKHIILLDRDGTAPIIPGIRYRTISYHDYDNIESDRSMLQQVCDEEGADLFISSYHTTPITTPSVFMAHDMIAELIGSNLNHIIWQEKHYAIKHASAFIAVSKNTARDLVTYFPQIALESVTIAENGVDHTTFLVATQENIHQFKIKYGITKPYFLLVRLGNVYKNSILFFKAFSQLPSSYGFDIVVTGSDGVLSPEFRAYTSGSIVHLLHLSDEELAIAYSGAVALVYPSKYEGFGLPILEAMACGCPVITCPNASIPEVAGEAAIYVNDNDVHEMANSLFEVQKPSIRHSLITAGLVQVQQFSWIKMAQTVSSVLINATLISLNLNKINLIIFPDWSQSEESLGLNLQQVIRAIATHPNNKNTTLLIDITNIAGEDAELFLSSVVMNLLIEEDLDVTEELEISLLGKLTDIQWKALLTRINARIILEHEDKQALAQVAVGKIHCCQIDNLSNQLNILFKREKNNLTNRGKVSIIDTLAVKDGNINIIIFPDWSQSEELLLLELEQAIKTVINHSDSSQITLLINTNGISEDDANLVLSTVAMNLLLAENFDITVECEISLLGNLDEIELRAIVPFLHGRIILQDENLEGLALFLIENIPAYEIESFNNIHIGQLVFDLSTRLFQEGRWTEAIAQYEKLLEIQSVNADIYCNLSYCYRQLNLLDEYFHTLQQGIELYPTEGRLHFSLIIDLRRNGLIQEAISSAEKAHICLPNDYTFQILKYLTVPSIYENQEEINFYRQRFTQGLQDLIQQTYLKTTKEQQSALAGIGRLTNFYLSYQAQNDIDLQRQYGKLVHEIMAANYPQWIVPLSMPKLQPNNKIRIGYASHYLHSYSGTLWLTGWLRYCDRKNFEIYCYYTGNEPDPITQQFQSYSDVFHHIPHNLPAACEQIIADKLHILVFPEIGMDAKTMQMAGLRLAPLQCVAWGHPVTTGLPTIDYFLSSELMEPENAQEHYSEKLIRLPNIGVSYPKPYIPPVIKTRSDFRLEDDAVIYLCCQAPFKYLPQYDFIFAEIACRLPQAKFVFLRGTLLEPRLKRAFAAVGLNSEDYCVFLSIPERLDYLMINLLSDVYLDTFTWSGGNTTLEAIACNLPIVTCPGEFMRGRHSDSFLKMLGVTDTIAQNEAEYIEIAVKLGLDQAWRRNIAERMSQNHDRLFDDKACVTGLEAFYKEVCSKH
ncbi:glycosyltransferase [Nostoc punctiforme]|uniref:Glycosyl transferase, group 1 n=1 Tax=Nostoc punctiforme (strain ATCC 29133 / PCC 73102) TaxID=63737 RepID=B2J9D1_NOSP7|nr:glycosyl transferase, group 1 [Nostoc punctiforme PCC 73102]